MAEGWSVLGTWAVGVRDGKGQWAGYGFIDELFAAQVASELTPSKDESFLLPYGETPLTHALPAGKRIYLAQASEPFLRVRAANVAARFGNYMREVTAPGALLGAAAFDERAGARRAFFGFAETAWDSAQADVDVLIVGALRWLQRRPIALKSAWPHPYQAAVLLEMDTEDKFDNSVRFAEQLERYKIRGTFYSVTSEAQKFPDVVKRLGARHEIAYHADVHNGFAKLARKEQERVLRRWRQLAKLVPDVSVATGFRAPLEQYDVNTEKALRAVGIKHHAASPAARDDALPGFSTAEPNLAPDQALVVLPRTWLDDVNLFTTGLLKGMPAEQMLLGSLQDTQAMRSFGLLSLHTQNFYAGSVLERCSPACCNAFPSNATRCGRRPAASSRHGGAIARPLNSWPRKRPARCAFAWTRRAGQSSTCESWCYHPRTPLRESTSKARVCSNSMPSVGRLFFRSSPKALPT